LGGLDYGILAAETVRVAGTGTGKNADQYRDKMKNGNGLRMDVTGVTGFLAVVGRAGGTEGPMTRLRSKAASAFAKATTGQDGAPSQ
jgi:hypothetical protein